MDKTRHIDEWKYRRIGILYACSLFIITFSSCDLFSTRTPAAPDLGSTFIWTPAATPNYLLDDFKGALAVLDATNYTKCFISAKDSSVTGENLVFSFTPRSGIDAAKRVIFDSWTTQSEQNFLTKLRASLTANPRLTVTLSNIQINQTNSNSATMNADYLILMPTQSNSSIPASINGSLTFQVVLVTTEQATKEWRIVNWTDFALSQGKLDTFTDLKVQLSS